MQISLALVVLFGAVLPSPQTAQPAVPAALRIVVLEGEDAVNVIQLKTAVAPVVEVRDRNNLPVSGVGVTFTIQTNAASFAGGAQSITVVTNAAGQATAAGLTPVAAGPVQISASALVEGQQLTATITQTNVVTAAQASAGAIAAGGAAKGLSGTMIGVIGGAVAAGGAAIAVASGGNPQPAPISAPPPPTSAISPSSPSAPAPTPPAPPPPAPPAPPSAPVCAAPGLSPNPVNTPGSGRSVDVSVTSNCPWTASNIPSYAELEVTSAPGSTTTRLRIGANPTNSPRTGRITFTAGTATATLEIVQDRAPQSVTYNWSGGGGSLQYVGAGDGCQYRTTITDVNISVTFPRDYDGTGSVDATSGSMSLTAEETSTGICNTPALGVNRLTYTLRDGNWFNTFLKARFAQTSGRPSTVAEMEVAGGSGPGGGRLYVTRNDASGPLNWTVVVQVGRR